MTKIMLAISIILNFYLFGKVCNLKKQLLWAKHTSITVSEGHMKKIVEQFLDGIPSSHIIQLNNDGSEVKDNDTAQS